MTGGVNRTNNVLHSTACNPNLQRQITIQMNANQLAVILLRRSSLSRPVCFPALQLPMLNSLGSFRKKYEEQAIRAVSINPYSGKDYQDEERELQRKKCHHGLKVEWVDFTPTIMERARSRLRETVMQRKRSAISNSDRSTPKKVLSAAPHSSQLRKKP